jgi:hypothetical protein
VDRTAAAGCRIPTFIGNKCIKVKGLNSHRTQV